MAMTLTSKQQRFVAEYAVDLNATQAAIRAGYAQSSAHVTGSQLLRHPKVSAELTKVHSKAIERAQVSLATEAAVASAAWIVEQAVKVIEIGMATVPVKGRDGKVISRTETDEDGNEIEVPEFYEAHNLAAVNGALKLLAQRHPGEFAPEAGSEEQQGARHLHLHGLSETDLRALASGFRA